MSSPLLCPSSCAAGCAVTLPKGVGSPVCRRMQKQGGGGVREDGVERVALTIWTDKPLYALLLKTLLPCTLCQRSRMMLLFPKPGARGPPPHATSSGAREWLKN